MTDKFVRKVPREADKYVVSPSQRSFIVDRLRNKFPDVQFNLGNSADIILVCLSGSLNYDTTVGATLSAFGCTRMP